MTSLSRVHGSGLMDQLLASATGITFNLTTGLTQKTVLIHIHNTGRWDDGMIYRVILPCHTSVKARNVSTLLIMTRF